MESNEAMSADLHATAKSAFDSLLIPAGFRRTADWINTGEHIDTGREYARGRSRQLDGMGAKLARCATRHGAPAAFASVG